MLEREAILKRLKPLAPLPTALGRHGRPTVPVRCVLFDVYGTLFISGSGEIGITKKMVQNLAEIDRIRRKYRIDKPAEELLADLYATIEAAHAGSKRTGTDYAEVDILQIWASVLTTDDAELLQNFAVDFEICVNPVYPMPHLSEVLHFFQRQKIPMGTVWNARFYTPLLFEWFFAANPIELGFASDLIFFSYRFGQAKPSAVLFKAAADALRRRSIPRQAALVVGNDMLNDIYPAHQAGFQTALFAGDARSLRLRADDARCRNLTPELVITDLRQLMDVFP